MIYSMAHKNLDGDTIWGILPSHTATMVTKWNEYNETEEQILFPPSTFQFECSLQKQDEILKM